jgi:hypothetical protein
VPIDRDVVLKQAENLLRQGELDGAIAEYLRLVDSEDVEGAYGGGFALLYDLADTLDRLGGSGRARAVLMELDADAAGYRGVGQRVERLARDQGRGPGA